jgi:hypothetical protein
MAGSALRDLRCGFRDVTGVQLTISAGVARTSSRNAIQKLTYLSDADSLVSQDCRVFWNQ